MKSLRTILVLVYVIIIILLLLSLKDCSNRAVHVPLPAVRVDTVNQDMIRMDSVVEGVPIKEKFKADVVMCIDCTNSMNNIITTIKNNAMHLYPDIKRMCRDRGKDIISMRIKVIGFRDFCDLQAFECSPFYDMQNHESDFRAFVSNLSIVGGGDAPERAYDALSQAFQCDWNVSPDVHQVVILWTDAESHPLLGTINIEQSTNNLSSLWMNKLNSEGRRLILFTPNVISWNTLVDKLDNTVRHDVVAGGGLSEVDYEEILKTLTETM